MCLQSKLAHRWLVSFSFGQKTTASHEYKKLKALLKGAHIHVRCSLESTLNIALSFHYWFTSLFVWILCLKRMVLCAFSQVGKVDCLTESELCGSLYIQKPCIAVFKGLGIHDFEIHHGKSMFYSNTWSLYFSNSLGIPFHPLYSIHLCTFIYCGFYQVLAE